MVVKTDCCNVARIIPSHPCRTRITFYFPSLLQRHMSYNTQSDEVQKCRLLSKPLNGSKSSLHSKHGSDFQIRCLVQSRLKKSFGLPPEISKVGSNQAQPAWVGCVRNARTRLQLSGSLFVSSAKRSSADGAGYFRLVLLSKPTGFTWPLKWPYGNGAPHAGLGRRVGLIGCATGGFRPIGGLRPVLRLELFAVFFAAVFFIGIAKSGIAH